ncbi:hypothetical protein GLOTRDRAFT_138703 [Gloeophyllum trabeum ATCC 11539]|uniref:Uncharacterized protein n=1 Tax=Gloeophyllum trabeum (strain ATCC 11539 / FP-39264 / Madison 617) TaxID=670483 RepID=S7Q7N5_GLOTA|nr:uncharacterized protein GLOTRDRAFT_138703 [Gloeophyllum trabeum ATCC 11539]EPQ56016.1 hypothetical protein GLOTRDRAFT_138703 [Gloeophyllum trabeum ATCC 11539]
MTHEHGTVPPLLLLERFHELGAPELSHRDLERLNKGRFGDAMLFLCEHMRGREETRNARRRLHNLEEDRHKSSLRAPQINSAIADVKKSQSSMIGARHEVTDLHASIDKRQKALSELDNEISSLRQRIQDKRAIDLMLNLLEKKAVIRVQRLQGLTELLEKLRKDVSQRPTQDVPETPSALTEVADPTPTASQMRDTLSVLRAHHVHLSKSDLPKVKVEVEVRLRRSIARILHSPEDSKEVRLTTEKVVHAAEIRALKKLAAATASAELSKARADELASGIISKQAKLQRLSDTTLALAHLSAEHAVFISTFAESTSRALHSSLEAESKAVTGHVDVLQWDISKARSLPKPNSFRTEICQVLGLPERTTSEMLLTAVEKLARQEEEAVLAGHGADEKRVLDHSTQLLTRKIEKAKKGEALVKDVKKTVREADKIASLAR